MVLSAYYQIAFENSCTKLYVYQHHMNFLDFTYFILMILTFLLT